MITEIITKANKIGIDYIRIIDSNINRYSFNLRNNDENICINEVKFWDIYAEKDKKATQFHLAKNESDINENDVLCQLLNASYDSSYTYRDVQFSNNLIEDEKCIDPKKTLEWLKKECQKIEEEFDIDINECSYTFEIQEAKMYSLVNQSVNSIYKSSHLYICVMDKESMQQMPFIFEGIIPFDDLVSNVRKLKINEIFTCDEIDLKIKDLKGLIKFSHSTVNFITESLSYLFNVDSVFSYDSSICKKDYHKEILPSYVNLYDSPNNYILNKSNIFDAEGVPTKRKTIIKNGILNSVIGDLFSSYQYNVDCSGNSKAIFPFYHDYTMSKNHFIWDIKMENKCKQEKINYEIINFTLGAQFNNITGYFDGTANYKDNTQNPPQYNKCQIHIHYTEIFKYLTEVENYEWFGSNYIPEFIIHFDKKENNS